MTKKLTNLHLSGRRWFSNTHGNTYHSARAFADGEMIAEVICEYGYGNHWLQTIGDALEGAGFLPGRKSNRVSGRQAIIAYCYEHDIPVTTEVIDVQRKRDLAA